MENFILERVLQEDSRSKTIFLLGRIPHPPTEAPDPENEQERPNDTAILKIEKTHFAAEEVPVLSLSRIIGVESVDKNDVYHWFFAGLKNERSFPDLKIELIYPATKIHVAKLTPQPRHGITETPKLYQSVVQPYIQSIPASRIQWVYNALDGTAEADRVLLRDEGSVETGFILLPDSKWDCKTLDNLYLQVLVLRRDLGSLRDLNASHLPLLKNVRDRVQELVSVRYGIQADELRIFVHYQPSYYHFHIHVTSLRYDAAPGIYVGQAHLLDTVINNIEQIAEDYYARCTMHYVLGERHPLYERIMEAVQVERGEEGEGEGKDTKKDTKKATIDKGKE